MQIMNYVGKCVELVYEVLFVEIFYDFYDCFKFILCGYVSMDYEQFGYCEGDLCKVDIMVNNEVIDVLVVIVYESKIYLLGCKIVDKMVEVIFWQMFLVLVQVVIGVKIIVCVIVKVYCKDVFVKCYGGDILCKKKLLEKQKKGCVCMKQFGMVEVLQEVFLVVLSIEE